VKLPIGTIYTALAALVGFGIGFGVGQRTRDAAPSNVKTQYVDGKVVITADVENALTTGVTDYLDGLVGGDL